MSVPRDSNAVTPFDFTSFGVKVRISGDSQKLVDESAVLARKALVGNLVPSTSPKFDVEFEVFETEGGQLNVRQDGELVGADPTPDYLFKYFNSLLRIAVAERAVDRLFIHAGAVAWKGKGIIFPGTSFVGKSTLVAELVRQGATYYSDDYAIFDGSGLLYPFPREISMRADDPLYTRFELEPGSLGVVGEQPVEVGTVVFTEYQADAVWSPDVLSSGPGILELMKYTFAFRERPEFALPILNKIAERAIIASSLRGSAENFAKILLDFVDKSEV